jgi:hypothetical protein
VFSFYTVYAVTVPFKQEGVMKIAVVALFFATSAFAQTVPAIVTAACGPEKTNFKVTLDECNRQRSGEVSDCLLSTERFNSQEVKWRRVCMRLSTKSPAPLRLG